MAENVGNGSSSTADKFDTVGRLSENWFAGVLAGQV